MSDTPTPADSPKADTPNPADVKCGPCADGAGCNTHRKPNSRAWRLRTLAQRIESWGDEIDCREEDADDVRAAARIIEHTEGDPTSIYHEAAELRAELERLRAERDALRANRDAWMAQAGLNADQLGSLRSTAVDPPKRAREIVARELRRGGMSWDVAEQDAPAVLTALERAGLRVVAVPDGLPERLRDDAMRMRHLGELLDADDPCRWGGHAIEFWAMNAEAAAALLGVEGDR